MDKVKNIEILLDNPKAEYTAGQTVTGKVIVQLSEPVETKGLFVKFVGDASTHSTEIECCWGVGTTSRFASETYFDDQQCLYGDPERKKDQPMAAGDYSFPFVYVLPLTAPSSFAGNNGRIRYYCDAEMELAWKHDPVEKKKFVVHGICDLNSQPIIKQPVTQHGTKNLCCWCCKSGPINVVVRLERGGFVPGDTIRIQAEITNLSDKAISETKAVLIQKTRFHAQNNREKSEKEIAETKKEEKIPAGETGYWNEEFLEIPSPLQPTNLGGCGIIEVAYVIIFTIEPDAIALPLTVKIPITIGSIPFNSDDDDVIVQQPTYHLPQVPLQDSSGADAGFVLNELTVDKS